MVCDGLIYKVFSPKFYFPLLVFSNSKRLKCAASFTKRSIN